MKIINELIAVKLIKLIFATMRFVSVLALLFIICIDDGEFYSLLIAFLVVAPILVLIALFSNRVVKNTDRRIKEIERGIKYEKVYK
ncbi:hypothetical protein [Streptobacillus moniliformis]|uniref:hypothetical protein n=1 Tax=Streptobacillus moniliformis TaxID=34105 RepID=UPI0007E3F3C6|nr:hypothetical protein [Streptobacillus moniliformis]